MFHVHCHKNKTISIFYSSYCIECSVKTVGFLTADQLERTGIMVKSFAMLVCSQGYLS